jgi:hypothetical protein
MKSIDFNTILVNSYFKLFNNLNISGKRALIAKLTQSITSESPKKNNFEKSFGSWRGEETAEELVMSIKNGRTFNRNIAEL